MAAKHATVFDTLHIKRHSFILLLRKPASTLRKKPESRFIVDIILHKNELDHLDLGVQKNSSHNFCSDD